MKKAVSALSITTLLLMGGLLMAPAFVYADESRPSTNGYSVPEPASLILLGAGLAGIAIARRKSS